jgi:hypothetical protein
MPCPDCNHTGHIAVEVPVFADGNYSDVRHLTAPCRCNPDPTDEDAPDFDGTLPADLLAAWEPDVTAWDDEHRFTANRYEGL